MSNEKESRYPWADAPKGTYGAATDKDGSAWWFVYPTVEGWDWMTLDEQIPGEFDTSDWQNSFEFNPAISQSQQPKAQTSTGWPIDADGKIDLAEWGKDIHEKIIEQSVAQRVQRELEKNQNDERLRYWRAQYMGQAMAAILPILKFSETPEKVAARALAYADAAIAALPPSPNTES